MFVYAGEIRLYGVKAAGAYCHHWHWRWFTFIASGYTVLLIRLTTRWLSLVASDVIRNSTRGLRWRESRHWWSTERHTPGLFALLSPPRNNRMTWYVDGIGERQWYRYDTRRGETNTPSMSLERLSARRDYALSRHTLTLPRYDAFNINTIIHLPMIMLQQKH